MNKVRMNYLHLFTEYVVFLHPSAFHKKPTPQPFIMILPITPTSWSVSLLSIPAHSSPHFLPLAFFSEQDWRYPRCSMYGIFTYIWVIFGVNVGKYSIHGASGYWAEMEMYKARGAKKRKSLGGSEKGRGEPQAVDHANDLNKCNIDVSWRILLFGINFWQPSPHSTLHSILAPPNHFTLPSPHSTHTLPPTSPPFRVFVLCITEGEGQKAVEKRRGKA